MLLLTSTSDIIRIVTGSAASVTVQSNYVDNASGTITPGRTNTAAITTATTTTVVGSPAASTQRNVKGIYITNNHASASTQVTVQHFDGTTSTELMGVTLLPGENLVYTAEGEWIHHDVQGADYAYSLPATGNLGPTGTIAETHPRPLLTEATTTIASGTLFMQAIYLTAGQTITAINLTSVGAATAPTNANAGIFDASRNLLAQSTNKTTTAVTANMLLTFTLTATWKVPTTGLYYIGYYATATTTAATIRGNAARSASVLSGLAPIIAGTSSTGLTTTLPNPAAAITASTASIYAHLT